MQEPIVGKVGRALGSLSPSDTNSLSPAQINGLDRSTCRPRNRQKRLTFRNFPQDNTVPNQGVACEQRIVFTPDTSIPVRQGEDVGNPAVLRQTSPTARSIEVHIPFR